MSSPGVYVFKRKGRVAYVGRGDFDVSARESKSFTQGDYDLTTDSTKRVQPDKPTS